MNLDFSNNERAMMEAKLTALLLGELHADEVAALSEAMEKDPELAALYERLKFTIELVREGATNPAAEAGATPLKLSGERREKLLASFKTVTPAAFARPRRRMEWLAPWAAAAVILFFFGYMAIPNFSKSRETARKNSIVNNLRLLDGAKQQWAVENNKSGDAEPTMSDLKSYLGRGNGTVTITSVAGETYVPGKVSEVTKVEASVSQARKLFGPQMVAQGQIRDGKVLVSPMGTFPGTPGAATVATESLQTDQLEPGSVGPLLSAELPVSTTPIVLPPGQTPNAGASQVLTVTRNGLAGDNGVASQGAKSGFGRFKNVVADSWVSTNGISSEPATVAFNADSYAPTTSYRMQSQLGTESDKEKFTINYGNITNDAGGAAGKVPFLGDVPAVGNLFRSESNVAGQNGSFQTALTRDDVGGLRYMYTNATVASQPLSKDSLQWDSIDGSSNAVVMNSFDGAGPKQGFAVSNAFAGWRTIINGGVVADNNGTHAAGIIQGEGRRSEIVLPSMQNSVLMNREVQSSADVPKAGEPIALALSDGDGFGGTGGFGGGGAVSTARRVVGGKRVEIAAATQSPLMPRESSQFVSGNTMPAATSARAYDFQTSTGAPLVLEEVDKNKTADYVAANDQLNDAKRWRQVLAMKTDQEAVDVSLPRAQMVSIMGPATAASAGKSSLGQKIKETFSGEVERTARIQIDQEHPDINGVAGGNVAQGYDPYFLLTEFQTIQSDAVLKKAVEKLKLDGGDPSKTQEAIKQLKDNLALSNERNSKVIDIGAYNKKPEEAARIANAVAEAYEDYRTEQYDELKKDGIKSLQEQLAEQDQKIQVMQAQVDKLAKGLNNSGATAGVPVKPILNDAALPKPAVPPPTPQPEILTRENAISTFSLNVSDVSFKLAAASLEKGQMPEPGSIRSEEFINAFDYRDPEAGPGVPIAFASERARYPFAHNRELLRFSLKTAAAGRQAGRPLNIVLLLDNSGSMERADRVRIIQEAMRVLAGQLKASDTFSIVTFARTARLRVDGIPGNQAAAAAEEIAKLTPEGGTNLGDALDLAYETALHHYLANGDNRVVLLTDGAANLGDVQPDTLKQKVEAHRQQGVALDCFGIGWEGYNDDLLEVLTRHGDGRYGFINTPEEASTEFVSQIAGALHVAAADVKVQVEFNPKRVTSYRQIGYAKHQLTKEQFRDNTVDAAEIAAQEAGNALYTIEINPQGEGLIATVRVRYKVPGTTEYREQAWDVPYTGGAVALDQASPAMRLAATASAFSEWLATSPFAADVSTEELLKYLNGVPQVYGADTRPAKLEWMIRQARSISGK